MSDVKPFGPKPKLTFYDKLRNTRKRFAASVRLFFFAARRRIVAFCT